MLTWYRMSVILPFPIFWFLLFLVLVIPDIPAEFLPAGVELIIGSSIRAHLVNALIIPFLNYELAVQFVNYWQQASYGQHCLVMLLISINLFIPISAVLFLYISLYMKIVNWWKSKAIEKGRDTARTI